MMHSRFPRLRAMQARLHAARPALSRRVRSTVVLVYWGDDTDDNRSARPALYPLMACVAMCLPRLEELSLHMGNVKYTDQEAFPSVLAPLACLSHLARLSVMYPTGYSRGADMKVLQAGLTFG